MVCVVYYLKHKESILQRANTRALLCAMVSPNRTASVYSLLILDPQCIVAINEEIMHTVTSDIMRNMLMVCTLDFSLVRIDISAGVPRR